MRIDLFVHHIYFWVKRWVKKWIAVYWLPWMACWVFPVSPLREGAHCSVQSAGGGVATDEGAAHCARTWLSVGLVGFPAHRAHSGPRPMNKSHFHRWCELQCLRGCRKPIKLSGQLPRLEGRFDFTPTPLPRPSAIVRPSLPVVSLFVGIIDQLNIYLGRREWWSTLSGLNMQQH